MATGRLNTKNKILTPTSGTTLSIDYSPKLKILEVEFEGGNVYHYINVKRTVWEQYKTIVLSGGSSGGFVNAEIKPNYKYKEIKT